jgi:hypothetical protein
MAVGWSPKPAALLPVPVFLDVLGRCGH